MEKKLKHQTRETKSISEPHKKYIIHHSKTSESKLKFKDMSPAAIFDL